MSAPKTQLQQLTEFLLNSMQPYVTANSIDAWQEGGTLILSGEDLGTGYQVAKWKHNAVIMIENFPHLKVAPYNLLAMIAAFLLDSDWPRDVHGLADPTLDIDIISSDNATVIIEVELMDNIDLLPDNNGPVRFNGSRYSVELAPVYVAETIDVQVVPGGDE